jgi:ATP-dependent Zn protease
VDLIAIARATPGMVGADIANLVNEAALLAARRNLHVVTQSCFEEALDKILLGAARPLVLSKTDLDVIAYHESGHALTAHRETLDGIAHSLLLHETLDARQLRAIMEDTSAAQTGPL